MLNASTAAAELWRRFIQRRMLSSNDCTPILILFTPSDFSPRTYSSPFSIMSSGLTSTVNSDQRFFASLRMKPFRLVRPSLAWSQEGAAPPNPSRFALRPVSPAASHPFTWPRAATDSAGTPLPAGSAFPEGTTPSGGKETASRAWTILDKTSSGSTDGVPPPMYKVLTFNVSAISSRRVSISPHTASAYASNIASRCGKTTPDEHLPG